MSDLPKVFDLPISESLRGLTEAQTWREFFEFEVDDGSVYGVTINPTPSDTAAAPRITDFTAKAQAVAAAAELALGLWPVATEDYHEFDFNRLSAMVTGAAYQLNAEGDWEKLDWVRSRNKLAPSASDLIPAKQQGKHNVLNAILSGQRIDMRTAAIKDGSALALYQILDLDLVEGRAKREEILAQIAEYNRNQGKAQSGADKTKVEPVTFRMLGSSQTVELFDEPQMLKLCLENGSMERTLNFSVVTPEAKKRSIAAAKQAIADGYVVKRVI